MNKDYVISLYGGKIFTQTGVASVIKALDDDIYWENKKLKHFICSTDLNCKKIEEKDSNIENFNKKGLMQKIRSKIRCILWSLSEKNKLIATFYVKFIYFKLSSNLVNKNLKKIQNASYLYIHDLFTLVYIYQHHIELLEKASFVSHTDGDIIKFTLAAFPSLKNSNLIKKIELDYIESLNYINKVICISIYAKNKTLNLTQINREKLVVIYNGFKRDGIIHRSNLNRISNDKLTINVTGTICQRKRQYILIDVILLLIKRDIFKEIILNIYGAGPQFNLLKKKINDNRLDNYIILHGYKPKPHNNYMEGEIFLLPSTVEGLPMAAIEASSKGNILMLTDVGGCKELCDLTGGILLEKTQDTDLPLEITDKIEKLFHEKNIIEKLTEKSLRGYSNNFSNASMINKYIDIAIEYKENKQNI